jgi:hypothetical protein
MKPNITQTALQSEVLHMLEENKSVLEAKTASRLEFDPHQVPRKPSAPEWDLPGGVDGRIVTTRTRQG